MSNSSRVKIYLDEWKARHVFDMAETYHAHHISCCTNSPSDATPFENLPKIVKNDALNDVFRTFCKKVKRLGTLVLYIAHQSGRQLWLNADDFPQSYTGTPGVTDSTVMQIYLASTRVWHSLTTCYHVSGTRRRTRVRENRKSGSRSHLPAGSP